MNLTTWQRSNILAAVSYLKDASRVGQSPQATVLAQGLMEVLEPSRRTVRLQREAALSAAMSAQAGHERRTGRDRRGTGERRRRQVAFDGPDRRSGRERRSGDRRS